MLTPTLLGERYGRQEIENRLRYVCDVAFGKDRWGGMRRPPNTERLSRPDGSSRKRGTGRPPHVAGIESLRLAHDALRNMDK